MNRRDRLKRLCTKRGMKAAALTQWQRRGAANEHRYVVGCFVRTANIIRLHCVRMNPGFEVPRPPVLTDNCELFCTWRTRQAAHQFTQRYGLIDLHVLNLHWLDVLPGDRTGQDANLEAQQKTA